MTPLIEYIQETITGHDYSSTQIEVPNELSEKILKFVLSIPDNDIYYDSDDPTVGRELHAHVTLKYGLTTQDPAEIESAVAKLDHHIAVKLGTIDLFSKDDKPYDVVFIKVESEDLNRLHDLLSKLDNEDENSDYVPHLTLAYVKKGAGDKYKGQKVDGVTGETFTVNSFMFKGSNGLDKLITLNEGNLEDHARRELGLAGMDSPDSDYNGMISTAVVDLMKLFGEQGHSGMSAAITREIFHKLSNFEPLTPITNNPDDWNDVSDIGGGAGGQYWQCKRDPTLFSTDQGNTYYSVNDDNRKLITSELHVGS